MAASSNAKFAAPLLGLAFLGHLTNVLFFEPSLGFSGPGDFYDVEKLLPVIGHPVWLAGAVYHFMVAAAVLMLGAHLRPSDAAIAPYLSKLGAGAALLFVLVGMTNIAGLREIGSAAAMGVGDSASTNAAFLVVRTVLLSGAVSLLGLFLLCGHATQQIIGAQSRVLRYIGYLAGAAFLVVPLVPAGTPVAILSTLVWAVLSLLTGRRTEPPGAAAD